MSQISPPLRILLVGSIVFMAAWFAFLRPGGGGDEPAPAPAPAAPSTASSSAGTPANPTTPYGKAVQNAQAGATAAEGAAAARAGESAAAPATAPGTTAAAGSSPAVAGAAPTAADLDGVDLPLPVLKALGKKVMVLNFGNLKAADDKRVRNSLRKVYKHQGQVVTFFAPIDQVAKYAPITRGANVDQSPTTIVVDRKLQVDSMVGYVDSVTINQSVVDALLQNGSLVDKDKYLQKLEGICGDYTDQVERLKDPRNLKQARAYADRVIAASKRFMARIEGAKVPSKWRGLRKQIDSLDDKVEVFVKILEADLRVGKPSRSLQRQARRIQVANDRLDLRLAGYGMEDCR